MAVYDQFGRPISYDRVGGVPSARGTPSGARSLGQLDPLPPCDLGKAQWIRLADVLLVGPLMVAGGWALREKHPIWGYSLLALGVGTMGLNGYNYIRFARDFGHTL